MRITVIGKSPAWQDADGACSGYLVEEGSTRVLLDCGSGVFGKLRRFVDYVDVDAVVISHLHADHILDLVPFASGLTYAPRQQPVPVDRWPGTDNPARPQLHVPAGGRDVMQRLCSAGGMKPDHVDGAFELEEYSSHDELEVGAISVRLASVPHYVPTCAVELRALAGGGRMTYGADSAPSEELIAFARGTELLIVEATLPRPEREGPRGHLTPREAGEHAAAADVRRLVLTHISDELDGDWAVAEAGAVYDGPVELAREGAVYEL